MRKFTVAIASFLATLFLAESVARFVLEPPRYLWIYPFDSELGFRAFPQAPVGYRDELGPFELHWNSRGYRGPEYPTEFEDEVERILFVGDSFVQGYGVRDDRMAHAVVEEQLTAAGRAVRCYTASGDGYGTTQEQLLFRRVRDEVRPDVVVLMFHSGNDVVNNSSVLAGRTNVSPGDYVRPYLASGTTASITYLHPARAVLRRYSRLFGNVEAHLLHNGFLETARESVSRDESERLASGLLPHEYLEVFSPESNARWTQAWDDTKRALGAFRDEVGDTRLVVVVVPEVTQVQRTASIAELDHRTIASGQPGLLSQLDVEAPEARLAAMADELELDVLFGIDSLRWLVAKEGHSVYKPDGHLNGRGQACLGEAIASHFLERSVPSRVGGPFDVVGWTVAREAIDFETDPREEVVMSGLEPAQLELVSGLVSGWRLKSNEGRLATSGRAGLVCVAGVVRGASPELRGFALDGELFPLATDGVFWETTFQAQGSELRFRSFGRAEGELLISGIGIAPPRSVLDNPGFSIFDELVELEPEERRVAIERRLVELPVAAAQALEGAPRDACVRLRSIGSQLEAVAAVATLDGPSAADAVATAQRLLRELKAHALPIVRTVAAAVDRESLLDWALWLRDPELLQACEGQFGIDRARELAQIRDHLSVARGQHQRYGTIGFETHEGWFGPPTVAADELARNRAELGF